MKRWAIGLGALLLAALGALTWWFVIDGAAPAQADNAFDLTAYRALVAQDDPQMLPRDVRMEIVGESRAPAFAAEAGAFGPERVLAYTAFQLVGPGGDTIIDAAVDQTTLAEMTRGAGIFDNRAYGRVLGAITSARHVLLTHEHLDHVMAIARHPAPEAIAPRLRLTAPQLAALPEHARDGVLPRPIAEVAAMDFSTPRRIAPGVVAAAAPGHSPGTQVIYVRTPEREYLFIGDIAWMMSSIEHLRGRPRLIQLLVPGVDPDRPAVLRQTRALHDLRAADPDLVIVPAHDGAYLQGLANEGALIQGFHIPPL